MQIGLQAPEYSNEPTSNGEFTGLSICPRLNMLDVVVEQSSVEAFG
jgi:hypothetical protein